MRHWFVAGAIIEGPDGVLLVRNERKNGSSDWSPPGGVVEVSAGEEELVGLSREVHEETGLRVASWGPLIYQVVAKAPALGWTMTASIYQAIAIEGDLVVGADPDGIVTAARYVPVHECETHLGQSHQWVREPLSEWLTQRWAEPRTYHYELVTSADGSRVVRRR